MSTRDPAVIELERRIERVLDTVPDPDLSDDPKERNDVTHDALQACIRLQREHGERFGPVVDPRIARILLGWDGE